FFDPNTHENLTYMQLLRRCVPDPDTGLLMLHVMDKGSVLFQLSKDARKALQSARTAVSVGLFQGQSVTVWELLFSRYVPEHRRQDLLRRYKAGTLSIPKMTALLTTIVTEAVEKSHGRVASSPNTLEQEGPAQVQNGDTNASSNQQDSEQRGDVEQDMEKELELERALSSHTIEVSGGDFHNKKVSLWELLFSKYVPEAKRHELLRRTHAGSLTLDELSRLLAVLVQEAVERSSKAATGFLVDPLGNQKLSVDEAVSSGLVGSELHEKLLSAERAVTGYTDPYSGDKISLFQAMRKELIVRDHGIRLLEAQIATGGIIDPVHSHRLPVEAAYRRGYFDEEMNRVLSDPSDDTKGFFDPNTHENLTYMQLLRRCVPDPDTGLYFLHVSGN
ncbi:hypothetical protein ASZ78_014342, partial [Callipepla squamata]